MHREMALTNDRTRQLMWHGIFLFLMGLLTGLLVPVLPNPRLGVSAHLEGLLNGIFLVVLGLVWRGLKINPKAATATFRIALYGTYMNWAFTLLGGILGTGALPPLAPHGRTAVAWKEGLARARLASLVR